MAYLAGIDVGTSSLKTIIMDEKGIIRASAAKEYQYDSPADGYCEQNIDVWWDACVQCLRQVTQKVNPAEIAGIGFSGQMHGGVFLDDQFRMVRPAILHLDTRSGEQLQRMKTLLPQITIQNVLMNPLCSGFLVPSLLWIKDHEPDHFHKIRHVVLPKDYLRYCLCGELHSDDTDASATLAFDVGKRAWAVDVLDTLGIPAALLPRCVDTDAVVGYVTAAAAQKTGLRKGTPVIAGGGDQVMQAIGNGVVRPGQATVNIGTSAQVSFQTNRAIENQQLNTNTFCGYSRDRYYTMGATMSAGLSLRWLRSLLGIGYRQLDSLAEKEEPGAGGLLFFPYLFGERTPYMDPDIRGMFLGLSTNTRQGSMARAVMEGVAYSLLECIEVCNRLGLHADEYFASGGGTQSPLWLQIQADIYGAPLKVADVEQHACVGAAIAAGSGCGIYPNVEEGCRRAVRYRDECYCPDMRRHERYTNYYHIYRKASRETQPFLHALVSLEKSR